MYITGVAEGKVSVFVAIRVSFCHACDSFFVCVFNTVCVNVYLGIEVKASVELMFCSRLLLNDRGTIGLYMSNPLIDVLLFDLKYV